MRIGEGPSTDEARDRARRLFEYVAKISELQSITVRDITTASAYEEVVWFGELPDAVECRSIARNDPVAPGEWLALRRPRFSPPPQPPEILEPWLNPARVRSSTSDLELNSTATIYTAANDEDGSPIHRPETADLVERPDIVAEFGRYLPLWKAWAAEERRLRPIHDVYTRLFAVQQRATSLEEMYEVVLGVGLVTRRRATNAVRRHLVVAQADVELDSDSGRITVGPAGDGMRLRFEYDMLETDETPEGSVIKDLVGRLENIDDPFAREQVDGLLQAWAFASNTTARSDTSLTRPADVEESLVVSFAPALILRRRSRRSIVDFCRLILEQLEGDVEIPASVLDIIEVEAGEARDYDASADPPVEVFFPLPANDEQLDIVDRISRSTGVVVEGPPGTGKSHTIANLIAHLTATGNRVLVTSHTARALTVLKGKLPPGIAELCVDVLGEGRERRDNLERSVTALLARHSAPEWSERRVAQRLSDLRADKEHAEAQRRGLIEEQRHARALEVDDHRPQIGDYAGSLSRIAERLRLEAPRDGWVLDAVDGPPPEVLTTLPSLVDSERAATPELEVRGRQLAPDPSSVPDVDRVRDALVRLESAETRLAVHGPTPSAVSDLVAGGEMDKRDRLRETVDRLAAARIEAEHSRSPWVRRAVIDVLAGRERTWEAIGRGSREALVALGPTVDDVDACPVDGLTTEARERLRLQALGLRGHLAAGGKLSILGVLRSRPVREARELLTAIRVRGRAPATVELLDAFVRHVDVVLALEASERAWGAELPSATGTAGLRRAALENELQDLDRVLALGALRIEAETAVRAFDGLVVPAWAETDAVSTFVEGIRHGAAVADVAVAVGILDGETAPFRDIIGRVNVAPEVSAALAAINQRDLAAYEAAFSGIRDIARARSLVTERDRIRAELAAILPTTTAHLVATAADLSWDDRLIRAGDAWEWRRAAAWLERMKSVRDDRSINREIVATDNRIAHVTGAIAENLAWSYAMGRLDVHAQRELRAYQSAMKRVGKGTGMHAQRHLADARRHLESCQTAVPVWIMPTHLVADTIQPVAGSFDVVIVDEASQSGVDAAFLFWLGKKVVIVGDERQISPDNAGIDRTAAHRHLATYLGDFRYRDVLDVDNSLFSQAAVRYAGRVRLREHFRCMPEIIEFSNQIAYADAPLIPLRQYGSERLDPLVARYVSGADTRGSSGNTVNDREAAEIAATIERLCADPRYAGKTMGVVSLLGGAQAKLINEMLVRSLPASEITQRRLRCGNAYAFQGDERDVMFLSLVAAPERDGTRLRAINERIFLQRYNVAASRAKDQEWLFHSVTRDDLKEECLRYKLLAHFVAPSVPELEAEVQSIPEDLLVAPFESLFEQRVYREIRERGYTVRPQVEVHGYRIDLVVTGRDRRLAVECDGDYWHGPDRYASDARRQRDLERCGWSFVRIRGSDFFADSTAALKPLWTTLEQYAIRPGGAAHPQPNPLIEHDHEGPVDVPGLTEISPHDDKGAVPEAIQAEALPWDIPESRPTSGAILDYRSWKPTRPIFPPGSAAATRTYLEDLLVEIVSAEGPMVAEVAYRRLVRAAGGQRVSHVAHRALNRAAFDATKRRRLEQHDPLSTQGQARKVLRMPGSPMVVVRTAGERDLDDIPPDEVAALSLALTARTGLQPGEALNRAILESYGRSRLTARASAYLDACMNLRGLQSVRAVEEPLGASLEGDQGEADSVAPRGLAPTARLDPRSQPGLGAPVMTPVAQPIEGPTTPDPLAVFWETVHDVVKTAESLPSDGCEFIATMWREADGQPSMDDAKARAIELGAESGWDEVAHFATTRLPLQGANLRGAIVDIAYLAFLVRVAPPEDIAAVRAEWPGRLLAAWRHVLLEKGRVAGETNARQDRCIHGKRAGACQYVICPHHPLGGIDFESG